MSTIAASMPQAPMSRGRVGMALLIFMESIFFSGFIVTYLFYIGRRSFGPQPAAMPSIIFSRGTPRVSQ